MAATVESLRQAGVVEAPHFERSVDSTTHHLDPHGRASSRLFPTSIWPRGRADRLTPVGSVARPDQRTGDPTHDGHRPVTKLSAWSGRDHGEIKRAYRRLPKPTIPIRRARRIPRFLAIHAGTRRSPASEAPRRTRCTQRRPAWQADPDRAGAARDTWRTRTRPAALRGAGKRAAGPTRRASGREAEAPQADQKARARPATLIDRAAIQRTASGGPRGRSRHRKRRSGSTSTTTGRCRARSRLERRAWYGRSSGTTGRSTRAKCRPTQARAKPGPAQTSGGRIHRGRGRTWSPNRPGRRVGPVRREIFPTKFVPGLRPSGVLRRAKRRSPHPGRRAAGVPIHRAPRSRHARARRTHERPPRTARRPGRRAGQITRRATHSGTSPMDLESLISGTSVRSLSKAQASRSCDSRVLGWLPRSCGSWRLPS